MEHLQAAQGHDGAHSLRTQALHYRELRQPLIVQLAHNERSVHPLVPRCLHDGRMMFVACLQSLHDRRKSRMRVAPSCLSAMKDLQGLSMRLVSVMRPLQSAPSALVASRSLLVWRCTLSLWDRTRVAYERFALVADSNALARATAAHPGSLTNGFKCLPKPSGC